MAVCIAILDRNSTPLKLMTNDPSKEVNFHYIVHTSLDVISERCSTSAPLVAVNVKSVETTRDQYLGILYSTEQYKVFGYITNVKMIHYRIISSISKLNRRFSFADKHQVHHYSRSFKHKFEGQRDQANVPKTSHWIF